MDEQEASALLIRLEELKANEEYVDSQIDDIKSKLKSYMAQHQIKRYDGLLYYLEYVVTPRYKEITPERLREILGKGAEQFIEESVNKEIRNALPPLVANKECPKISETEFVRLVKKKAMPQVEASSAAIGVKA
jgi:hypothetical protein